MAAHAAAVQDETVVSSSQVADDLEEDAPAQRVLFFLQSLLPNSITCCVGVAKWAQLVLGRAACAATQLARFSRSPNSNHGLQSLTMRTTSRIFPWVRYGRLIPVRGCARVSFSLGA